jgi:hypothetical protein
VIERRAGTRALARLGGPAAAIALLTVASDARADLEVRTTKFAWDKAGVLRGTFTFRDAIDDAIRKKLSNGLAVTIVMRGYVYPNAGGDPVALTAHTCRVAYDLWNEVFRVVVDGTTKPPVVNLKGVYRLCTDLVDHPIVEKATLKGKPDGHFLAVKVEVNPVSEATIKEIQRWVTRPLGPSGSITAGDALFATFVGVFMKKQVAGADRIVEFRTASFPP